MFKIAQSLFIIFLLVISNVYGYQDHSSFLRKTLENDNFFSINLKKIQTTSQKKHEIFDFVAKTQSYLVSPQEKSLLLSTNDHKSTATLQKISLYNFKNTQVLYFSLKTIFIKNLVYWPNCSR